MAIEGITCMMLIIVSEKGFFLNSVPERIRKEYSSREDNFDELSNIIKNDKDTIHMFVDFLMSIDLSEYTPRI